jgi:hypothetical protein
MGFRALGLGFISKKTLENINGIESWAGQPLKRWDLCFWTLDLAIKIRAAWGMGIGTPLQVPFSLRNLQQLYFPRPPTYCDQTTIMCMNCSEYWTLFLVVFFPCSLKLIAYLCFNAGMTDLARLNQLSFTKELITWWIEKRRIIWITKGHIIILIHTLSFFFKLFYSFPYVICRDEIPTRNEISPCKQPLTVKLNIFLEI